MQKISSDITLIRWSYSVILTIVAGIMIFTQWKFAAAAIWISLMLILVTVSIVFDGKKSSLIFKALAFGTCCAIFPISGYAWWAGFVLTAASEIMMVKKTFIKAAIAIFGSALGIILCFFKGNIQGIELFKFSAILFGGVALYIVASYFSRKMAVINESYEEALRRSALDSMTERKLREELSYRMAEEEMNARLLERERISRDIHNSVGHTLSAASVTLDAAKILVDTDSDMAREKMTVANDRIKESIDSIRSVVRTMESKNNTVIVKDYVRSLSELTSNFSMDTDIKVYHNFDDIDDEGTIDISVASFISGALSELLTNGMKHGNASVFVIMLIMDAKHILLKVQDNGKGFGNISYEEEQRLMEEGFGLKKLQRHASSLGGKMAIDGSDGFKVTIDIPRVEAPKEA